MDNTPASLPNEEARERLFRRFAELGIAAPTVPYPTHKTVEEGKIVRGAMAGTFMLVLHGASAQSPRSPATPHQILRRSAR